MLEALSDLSPDELRKEWRRLYRIQPPRLSRDLLVRAIAYRIQELRYGGRDGQPLRLYQRYRPKPDLPNTQRQTATRLAPKT